MKIKIVIDIHDDEQAILLRHVASRVTGALRDAGYQAVKILSIEQEENENEVRS